jgi:CBS domain-containing protein
MVVLARQSMAYQAARAMVDHHIGAVLVSEPPGLAGILTDRDLALAVLEGEFDPKTIRLDAVMSEGVVTCDIGADLDEVVRLMREHAVRRIPITENGRPVGLVTFDDLVVDGAVSADDLRAIVTAQLEVEAPQKPAGALHPKAPASAEGRTRALMRARARAEATYNRMVKAVADATTLDRTRSERSLFLVTCMLCRRLTPEEAQHLIAQLPSKLQPRLDECLNGPDRAVTAQAIKDELGRGLGLDPQGASETLRSIFRIISDSVAAGQIDEVRGQLPEEMRTLFPVPG